MKRRRTTRVRLVMATVMMACTPLWLHANNPSLGGQMKHLLITLPSDAIQLGRDHDGTEIMALTDYCEFYEGAAGALDGMAYNGQYGWLANGFISLPPQYDIWIEVLEQSDGLMTYEQGTYQPIFGTEGSDTRWRWSGIMTHNWYAVMEPGFYFATYRVYVADANGEPVEGYAANDITVEWEFGSSCIAADMNCDTAVTLDDVALFVDVLLDATGATANQRCGADTDENAIRDSRDIAVFIGLLLG